MINGQGLEAFDQHELASADLGQNAIAGNKLVPIRVNEEWYCLIHSLILIPVLL